MFEQDPEVDTPAEPTSIVDEEILKGVEKVAAKCVSAEDATLYEFQDAFSSVARWMLVGLAVINSGIAVIAAAKK